MEEFDRLLRQARRIAQHREKDAEQAIRKLYRETLSDLKAFIGQVHERYARGEGELSYADLQRAGYAARYLEEIEQRLSQSSDRANALVTELVQETYTLAFEAMTQAVGSALGTAVTSMITPDQMRNAVSNPLMELALQKNHRDTVYEIKRAVAVGLMNGDRYTTVARRLTELMGSDAGAYQRAVRIARTETHRVREAGNTDAAIAADRELQSAGMERRLVKVWRTMQDARVRPQQRRKGKRGWVTRMGNGPDHMAMEGQTVLVDEPFELGNGVRAMQPGSSGVAGHDINCRCYASMELMDDEEFFKRTGRHFPGWNEQGNASETIEKSSENGIMEMPGIPILFAIGASGKNYPVRLPDGNHTKLAPGTTITKIKVFAGKGTQTPIRAAKELEMEYNIKAEEWQKVRGDGYVLEHGKRRHVELHWYEAYDERVEMKIKRYFDDEG